MRVRPRLIRSPISFATCGWCLVRDQAPDGVGPEEFASRLWRRRSAGGRSTHRGHRGFLRRPPTGPNDPQELSAGEAGLGPDDGRGDRQDGRRRDVIEAVARRIRRRRSSPRPSGNSRSWQRASGSSSGSTRHACAKTIGINSVFRWEDIFPFYDDGERRDGERAVTNFDALERMFDDGS